MHPTALENARRFRDVYNVTGTVLDVGAYDVNGTLRPVFANYVGVDLEDGPNVDHVIVVGELPFEDNSFDAVVSSSCLEHDPRFWMTFQEMCRVSKDLVYINAPSKQGWHRYPLDCWRFGPDAMQALAEWAEVELVESYIDERKPWCDCVGIFRCNS